MAKKKAKKAGIGIGAAAVLLVVGGIAVWYSTRRKETGEEEVVIEPVDGGEPIYVPVGGGGATPEEIAAAVSAALAEQSQLTLSALQQLQQATTAQTQAAIVAAEAARTAAEEAIRRSTKSPEITVSGDFTSGEQYRTTPVEIKPPLSQVIRVTEPTEEDVAAERAARAAEEAAGVERERAVTAYQAQLSGAKAEYSRLKSIAEQGIRNYESAKAAIAPSKSRLDAAKASVQGAKSNLLARQKAIDTYNNQVQAMSTFSKAKNADTIAKTRERLVEQFNRANDAYTKTKINLNTVGREYNRLVGNAESVRTNSLKIQSDLNSALNEVNSIQRDLQGIQLYASLARAFTTLSQNYRSTINDIQRRLAPLSYAYEKEYI